MQAGDKVYDFYASESFSSVHGFSFWLDENEMVTPDVEPGESLVRSKYGKLSIRDNKNLFLTKAAAQEAVIAILESRIAKVQEQIVKMRQEIEAADGAVVA